MNAEQRMTMEGNPLIARSHQLYGWLLTAYPRPHREEYGPAMQQVFRDQCRDAWREARGWGLAMVWLRVLPDLVKTSVLEHLATLSERKSMLERMAAMLRPRSGPSSVFWSVFTIVFLLVVAVATIVTFILPENYAATARIKVERDFSDKAMPGSQAPISYDPYFIQTEYEVIQSQAVLGRVAEVLDLKTAWGKRYAAGMKLKEWETLALLRGRLELRPVRNTSLIEIRAFGEDAGEAAAIANAVAETYRDYRLGQRQQLAQTAIRVLEERYAEQENKVRKAQAEVDQLRRTLEISETDAAGSSAIPMLDATTLRQFEARRIESQTTYAREAELLRMLKSTSPDELRKVLPTAVQDPQLNELFQQLNLVEQSRIQLKKDASDDHPSVVVAARQIADLDKKIGDRADGIMKGLEVRVASLKKGVDSLLEQVEQAKKADVANAKRTRPYFEAKRELEDMLAFKRILEVKLASESIDAAIPKSPTVEIVERATPSLRPFRPNKPMLLFSGLWGGIVFGSLTGGLAAWRASRVGRKTRNPALVA